MEKVETIFELLDDWRHLPTYQLERRADIFFSLYLREILEAYTGEEIHEFVIPEFPLHKKALDSGVASNRHYCADYLAFSRDMKRAFLVELKTEADSSSKKQNECLRQARDVGLEGLLTSMLKAFKPGMGQKTRRKRFYLLRKLESIGLVSGLESAANIIAKDRHQGFTKALEEDARISSAAPDVSLVCIHPNDEPSKKVDENTFDCWVSFKQVLEVVKKHPDPLSQRFARSLTEWSKNAAGSRVNT